MAKTIQKFLAEDGTEFDSLEAANEYEATLELRSKAQNYLAEAGVEGALKAKLEKHLVQFQAFVNDGLKPQAEVKKPRKPRTKKEKAPEAANGEAAKV